MPKVSVVIPIFKVEKYIRRCLESIQCQSLRDIEIIVVNDETPDNSMVIVHELAKDDQRIVILNHEKNMGPMCARETGYMAATGDFLFFCDGDDFLPSTAIEKLYHAAVESNADIVAGNSMVYSKTGKDRIWKNELKYGNNKVEVLKSLLRWEIGHSLWGKIYKASLFQNYKYKTYRHATNGEDGCLFYQIIDNISKMALIDDVVYYYNMQNIESSTQIRLNENAINGICIFNKMKERIALPYPQLHGDLKRCITNGLCGFYIQGYHKEGIQLNRLIKENGLEEYVTFTNIVRYLNYNKMIKLLFRHYFPSKG